MKPLIFTIAMLLVVSCGGVAQKQNNAKELSDTLHTKALSSSELYNSIEEVDEELATMLKKDSLHDVALSEEPRSYTIAEDGSAINEAAVEAVFRSPVYRNSGKDVYWFEFTKYEPNPNVIVPKIGLKITHNNSEVFNENIRWNGEFSFDCEAFYPTANDGIVAISDAALYFIDIDFDGTDEIITDLYPFAGSQRDCSAYCAIYKLKNGTYVNVYDEFVARCEVFGMLDTYGVEFDSKTKEIYHSNIAGAYRYLDVYAFADGKYWYDRRIEYEPHSGSLTIFNGDREMVATFHATESDIERNWWDYVRCKEY